MSEYHLIVHYSFKETTHYFSSEFSEVEKELQRLSILSGKFTVYCEKQPHSFGCVGNGQVIYDRYKGIQL